jgi:hypothetical protein
MAVTLLQLQGGQLRQLALVPDALGLCAPAHAPAGMLCPVLAASKPQQLQQQRRTDATNTGVLQLAAGILLSSNSHRTGQQDSQAASSLAPDLRCYAVLETAEKAASLPGPLLCVLAQAPAASGQQGMQAAAGAAARLTEAAAAAGGGDGGSEAAPGTGQASSELQGLHMMLAALEHRWQHGKASS